MNPKIINQKRGISPIIATLLLILIAIAAGVVVYAYVIGFVGNSTGNSGATTDTLSIDQLTLASKTTNFPVTAFVRNEGPSTESFNTGFFVKGSALNDQLAVAISVTSSSTDSITGVVLGSSSSGISVELISASCTAGHTATVSVLGTSVTVTCGSGSFWGKAAVSSFTITNSTSSNEFATVTIASTPLSNTAQVVGVPAVPGASISLAINTVGQFTLAASGLQSTNPLTSGQTYTFQVTGTDGGSTAASNKAS